jgi:hypothetical protein
MPLDPNDTELAEQVRTWRAKASELIKDISVLLELAKVLHTALVNLTPERISALKRLGRDLTSWIGRHEKQATEAVDSKTRDFHTRVAGDFRSLLGFLSDLGID